MQRRGKLPDQYDPPFCTEMQKGGKSSQQFVARADSHKAPLCSILQINKQGPSEQLSERTEPLVNSSRGTPSHTATRHPPQTPDHSNHHTPPALAPAQPLHFIPTARPGHMLAGATEQSH
jgi:hypothetical protein